MNLEEQTAALGARIAALEQRRASEAHCTALFSLLTPHRLIASPLPCPLIFNRELIRGCIGSDRSDQMVQCFRIKRNNAHNNALEERSFLQRFGVRYCRCMGTPLQVAAR